MKIEKGKKIKIIKFIIRIIVSICVIYNILFSLNSTITQKDYLKLFGFTFLKMETDLMEKDISKSDLVIVKSVQEQKLQEGDIIAYTVNGHTRINKIINIKNGYTTKSNKNYYPDIEKISFEEIIGKKVVNMPFGGTVIEILQSKITTAFIFVFLIFGLWNNQYKYIKKEERTRKKKENEKKVK